MTSTFRPASRADCWFVARFSVGTSRGAQTRPLAGKRPVVANHASADARRKVRNEAWNRVLASLVEAADATRRTFNILVIGPPSPTFLYYEARHTHSRDTLFTVTAEL